MRKKLFSLLLCLVLVCSALAQNNAYLAYIENYKKLAVEQMDKYGIPASITLAQGLLESGAGRSFLAVKANNHFGIKTGDSWTGPYVLKDDDARDERFRVYRSVEESYEDHSLFLARRGRYASLFTLRRTDYKGWAKGLKAAGYATNPQYASLLISLIERYDLHRFDLKGGLDKWDMAGGNSVGQTGAGGSLAQNGPLVMRCNGNYYVVARWGDTYASIGKWAGVSERKLRRYNEVPKKMKLQPGDIVYMEKKRTKAARTLKGVYHVLKAGESIHRVAQTYGMKMSTLYKLNGLSANDVPHEGMRLLIR